MKNISTKLYKNLIFADECYGRATFSEVGNQKPEVGFFLTSDFRLQTSERYTEGVILSGKVTMARRTSGETVKAPKGQVRGLPDNLSGKRTEWHEVQANHAFLCDFRGQIVGFGFFIF